MQDANDRPEFERLQAKASPSYLTVPTSEMVVDAAPPSGLQLDIPKLLRQYALLAVLLTILGTAAGFVAVAFIPPRYKAKARLEIQPTNSVMKMSGFGSDGGQVDIQTEAQILTSNTFLRQVIQRLQVENVSPAPMQSDLFARMRRYLRLGADDGVVPQNLDKDHPPEALAMVMRTLDAHSVDHTLLLEVECDSTNPQFAADFLNALTDEYRQQNLQAHNEMVQVTNQWLLQQVEETRKNMLDAEQRLRDFVQSSGNLFVTPENTLADSQLKVLQDRLSLARSELLTKQSKYDTVQKAPAESLPDLLNDGAIADAQQKIADLGRQKALLLVNLTPANVKVKQIDVQIADQQGALKRAVESAKKRVGDEYEAARRNVDVLNKAYSAQAQQVGAQAGKETQYSALKRESETARTTYNTLLLQANQANIAGSVPVNNIRVVDPAIPPDAPYKPKPPLIIGIGAGAGLGLCAGIAVLKQMLNQRVTTPQDARQLFNLPQLGVIPSATDEAKSKRRFLPEIGKSAPAKEEATGVLALSNGNHSADSPEASWKPLMAESFRVTLASLMRESPGWRRPQVILVTSASPEEGKTTIASNLGIALAETGRRVLVLDCDFRRPSAHKMFGIPNTRGLVNLLEGEAAVKDIPVEALGVRTSFPRLWIMPNGGPSENIAKALYSSRLRELIERLRKEYDTVLIDAPPMLHLADARVMSEFADGVVLVLRSGVTERHSVTEALDQLRSDGAVILGTVLNDWKPSKVEIKKRYYYSSSDSQFRT